MIFSAGLTITTSSWPAVKSVSPSPVEIVPTSFAVCRSITAKADSAGIRNRMNRPPPARHMSSNLPGVEIRILGLSTDNSRGLKSCAARQLGRPPRMARLDSTPRRPARATASEMPAATLAKTPVEVLPPDSRRSAGPNRMRHGVARPLAPAQRQPAAARSASSQPRRSAAPQPKTRRSTAWPKNRAVTMRNVS